MSFPLEEKYSGDLLDNTFWNSLYNASSNVQLFAFVEVRNIYQRSKSDYLLTGAPSVLQYLISIIVLYINAKNVIPYFANTLYTSMTQNTNAKFTFSVTFIHQSWLLSESICRWVIGAVSYPVVRANFIIIITLSV